MVITSLSLLLCVLGQVGDISPDQVPYELSMADGERIFAFVLPTDLNGKSFRIPIVLDAPWLRPSQRNREIIRGDILESQLELPALRKGRLKKGWIRHKGMLMDTPDGPQWVLRSEVEFSDRANALAKESVAIGDSVSSESQAEAAVESVLTTSPGFLGVWGIHIAVGSVSLLGIGLAAWWGFFRKDWASI